MMTLDLRTFRAMVFGTLWLMLAFLIVAALCWLPPVQQTARLAAPAPFAITSKVSHLALPEGDVWAKPGFAHLSAEVQKYLLAGTFLTYDEQGNVRGGVALIDDSRQKRQLMLREGERLGPFVVERITADHVQLGHEGQTWTLQLSGVLARGVDSVPTAETRLNPAPMSWEDMPALETNRFGKRVAENQWVIHKQAVEQYAQEILADPRRAVNLYGSFTQVARDPDEPAGFLLQMRGEQDFFTSMGLNERDVIRRVNSMEMRNQGRAEYLVGEFMRNRMSMVVLDVERAGRMEKLIYIIR